MEEKDLGSMYIESVANDKKRLQEFWDNLSEQQKNEYINSVNQINGTIDWQAKARELVLDQPSMGRFFDILREEVLASHPKALERWDSMSNLDKVLYVVTLFKKMDDRQKN